MADQNYHKLEKHFYCEICGAHTKPACHERRIELNLPKCAVCGILNENYFGGRFLHMYLTEDEILCSTCIGWTVDYPADLQMYNAIKNNRKFWLGS